jgi:hypothetical protein
MARLFRACRWCGLGTSLRSLLHHRVGVGDPAVDPAEPEVEALRRRPKLDGRLTERDPTDVRRIPHAGQARRWSKERGAPGLGRHHREIDFVQRILPPRSWARRRRPGRAAAGSASVTGVRAARTAAAGSASGRAPRSVPGATTRRPPAPGGTPSCTRTSSGCRGSAADATRADGDARPGTASARPRGHRSSRLGSGAAGRRRRARLAGSSRAKRPLSMRPKAEACPFISVLDRWRCAPICPAPALGRQRSLWLRPPTALGVTSVEHHDDSRIAPEALAQLLTEFRTIAADHDQPSAQPLPDCPCAPMTLPSAGRGPGSGTRMALMHPLSITFLAIVVVVSRPSRDRPPPGRGGRETLPQHVPVPWGAEDPKATDADGPASPEWIMNDNSSDPVQGWCPFLLMS